LCPQSEECAGDKTSNTHARSHTLQVRALTCVELRVENKWKTAFGLLQVLTAFSKGFHVLNRLKHLHDVFIFGEAYLGYGNA